MITVTGAAGHIGNVLIRQLLQDGRGPIRALVLEQGTPDSLQGLDIEIVRVDIRDLEKLQHAFVGSEVVFHLASVIAITKGSEKLLQSVNVQGTRNVITACQQAQVRRLVYTSSIHALDEPPKGTTITEACGFRPEKKVEPYERTKAQASAEVVAAAKDGLDAVVVCPSGVVGPHDYLLSEMGAMFIEYLKGKLIASVDGAYDFVDVRDVVTGMIRAMDSGVPGETYILSGEKITVDQIYLILSSVSKRTVPRFTMPIWLAKLSAFLAQPYYKILKQRPLFTHYSIKTLASNSDISHDKATSELSFRPRPAAQSIKDSVAWFRRQGMV